MWKICKDIGFTGGSAVLLIGDSAFTGYSWNTLTLLMSIHNGTLNQKWRVMHHRPAVVIDEAKVTYTLNEVYHSDLKKLAELHNSGVEATASKPQTPSEEIEKVIEQKVDAAFFKFLDHIIEGLEKRC